MRLANIIYGAMPDYLLDINLDMKKQKTTKKEVKKMHAKKQSFWSKATGGRMK